MARLPKSKLEFWLPKLSENRRRDQRVIRKLRSDGWKVLVVWECQLNDLGRVEQQVRRFLHNAKP
jgi:DNA mismatch endonuclease (patch repair protein)